jgi:hypothetical protein
MITPDRPEAELVAEQVNRHPTGATDPEEESILERLYGPADPDGIYRGEPQS